MGIFKGKHAKLLTLTVSLTLIIILTYIAVTDDKESEAKSDDIIKNNSEIEKLLEKDLQKDYPASPREVVKVYCNCIKCMYNNELSDETFERLLDIEYELFDKELSTKNDYGDLLKKQQAESEEFRKKEDKIFNYEVDSDENNHTWTNNNRKCAAVEVCFKITGKERKDNKETFILRQDDKENWKIVGMTTEEEMKKENSRSSAKRPSNNDNSISEGIRKKIENTKDR